MKVRVRAGVRVLAPCAPVLLREVADDVERPVEVLQRDDLAAHRVVEPAGHVGVDQAVAHPDARADLLRDLLLRPGLKEAGAKECGEGGKR